MGLSDLQLRPECFCNRNTVEFFADGKLVGTVTESLTAALGVYVSVLPDQELWPAMVKFMNSSYEALH